MSQTTTRSQVPAKAAPAGELDARTETALIKIDQIAEQFGVEPSAGLAPFRRAVNIARGIQALRQAVTPDVMAQIMPLQGSQLGFRTDKDKEGGYPADVVKECFIEATLRGVPTGCNTWNILAGRMYITREGYSYLVKKLPNLSNLKLFPGVPKASQGGALVDYKATFKLDGEPQELQRTIPVRVTPGAGADNILGKAARKMLKAVYEYVVGSEHSVTDPEEEPMLGEPEPAVKVAPPEDRDEQAAEARGDAHGG